MTNFPPKDDRQLFLHKNVKVTLDYDDPEAYQIGVLVDLSDDGEATVIDSEGTAHKCWPALRIEEFHGHKAEPPALYLKLIAGIIALCLLIIVIGLTIKVVLWVIP